MKILLMALALTLGGCASISPEQKRALRAPLGSVQEITKAATAFVFAKDRWPLTKEELEEGFGPDSKPEFLSDIDRVTVLEQSPRSIVYRCTFPGGGSSEVRINLNEELPVQAFVPVKEDPTR